MIDILYDWYMIDILYDYILLDINGYKWISYYNIIVISCFIRTFRLPFTSS